MRTNEHGDRLRDIDPSDSSDYCPECHQIDDCQCVYDPEGDAHNLTLDQTEATAQWFDERNAREAERDAELQSEQRQRELQEATDDQYDIPD